MILAEIVNLSVTTQMKITGTKSQTELDNVMTDWAIWIGSQPVTKKWESWIECWVEFSGSKSF